MSELRARQTNCAPAANCAAAAHGENIARWPEWTERKSVGANSRAKSRTSAVGSSENGRGPADRSPSAPQCSS